MNGNFVGSTLSGIGVIAFVFAAIFVLALIYKTDLDGAFKTATTATIIAWLGGLSVVVFASLIKKWSK
jgi:hypothetical protein